ncbi:hypothetical protein [Actinomycetospora corticicola]|uniref:Uncharacterized protein n=1 Tax=Actinomycetospora corticicola TaxID=663602 RepID=A0A7Y9J624_9PSEU|nr:hypothetical protein [Actinomycetospora corticicola]NYD36773.1 hypothetical protein [Actinomycetospora corticicola]
MRALLGKLARAATPAYDLQDAQEDVWVADGPDWWRLVPTDSSDRPAPRTTRAEVARCYGPVVELPHIGGA